MTVVYTFDFPSIPPELRFVYYFFMFDVQSQIFIIINFFSEILLKEDKTLIIVGVIGKSSNADCNKMAGLQMLRTNPVFMGHGKKKEGDITFYHEKGSNMLFIHFLTSYDTHVMLQMLEEWHEKTSGAGHTIDFHRYLRLRFARILLFAIQVSHLIVLVETGNSFDASYLLLFKSLKIIR